MPAVAKSQVWNMADLVSYQDGAVVSRQITRAEKGNVTLFAFDAGQELSEHNAPYDALVHILEGEAEIHISGQAYPLAAGEAIVIPANAAHAIRAAQRFKMLLTMIRA